MAKKRRRPWLEEPAAPAELGEAIGFPPDSLPMLATALTHKSYANEFGLESYERLEFLGDAVLSLVVSEYLYREFPEANEGQMAKMRAAVVSAPTLARRARALDLGRYLRLGRGEALTGGRSRESNLADAFEAVIGALYIQAGLEAARGFILGQLRAEITEAACGSNFRDYKTRLQEVLQGRGDKPTYEVTSIAGPDHGREFTVAVYAGGKLLGRGQGHSKKAAEQTAARQALEDRPEA